MNILAADSVAAPTAALVVVLIVALPETELVSVAQPDKNLETDTVADNLRKGAASNVVQILEKLMLV